eukprot:jgi/Galph1/5573/GphlegSOOS_G4255.1
METTLKVRNSLSKTKEVFQPWKKDSKTVYCYICGPTVYDSAHVGHARNYLSFDTVRRILEQYFGYDVQVQMNITDVDDKIIQKSKELQQDFGVVSERTEFWDDMESLNCIPPTYKTRVTDYMPEIISFIERIVANGFGYEAEGSVYFDTEAFLKAGYQYGKLDPTAIGDMNRLLEGEGSWGSKQIRTEKKSLSDFALWKKSQEGEPSWQSPWGYGRPGWHVECSAMACCVLGSYLDMHCGGEDLRFPHHENEIAQTAAYLERDEWAKYFLHSGHLHIDGLKMSKSLKNFITIRSVTSRYSARQLRLYVLQHHYAGRMNYSEHGMQEAVNVERSFVKFFQNYSVLIREWRKNSGGRMSDKVGEREKALLEELERRRSEVHLALCDDFDTPNVIISLQGLLKATNVYIETNNSDIVPSVVTEVVRYMSKILNMLGLGVSYTDELGIDRGSAWQRLPSEQMIHGLLDMLVRIREVSRSQLVPLLKKTSLEMSFSTSSDQQIRSGDDRLVLTFLLNTTVALFNVLRLFLEDVEIDWESLFDKLAFLKDDKELSKKAIDIWKGLPSVSKNSAPVCLETFIEEYFIQIESILKESMGNSTFKKVHDGLEILKTAQKIFLKSTWNVFRRLCGGEDWKNFLYAVNMLFQDIKNSQNLENHVLTIIQSLFPTFQHTFLEESVSKVIRELDIIRDERLPELGVRIEDKKTESYWKIEDPEELKRELARKREQENAKEEEKRKRREEIDKRRQEELTRSQIPPHELFKQGEWKGQFSRFDSDGIPSHDKDGKEISKSLRKKLVKEQEKQKKLHEKYLQIMSHE